jgi:hypothetical protein
VDQVFCRKTTANSLTPMNMNVMGLIIPAALGQHARSWTSSEDVPSLAPVMTVDMRFNQ